MKRFYFLLVSLLAFASLPASAQDQSTASLPDQGCHIPFYFLLGEEELEVDCTYTDINFTNGTDLVATRPNGWFVDLTVMRPSLIDRFLLSERNVYENYDNWSAEEVFSELFERVDECAIHPKCDLFTQLSPELSNALKQKNCPLGYDKKLFKPSEDANFLKTNDITGGLERWIVFFCNSNSGQLLAMEYGQILPINGYSFNLAFLEN